MQRIMKMKRITKGLLLLLFIVVVIVGGRWGVGTLLREAPPVLTQEEEAMKTHALELHHNAVVVDGHNDIVNRILEFGFDLAMDGDEPGDRNTFLYEGGPFTWLPNPPYGENVATDMDFARVREGGLDVQFFSIWVDYSFYDASVPGQSTQRALDMIEALQEQVHKYPGNIENAYTTQDVERIVSENKLAVLMSLEGGHAIEDDLENLRRFYELGVRNMMLTHNSSHNWADSSTDVPINNGLSEFGREVVEEMNHLGMIVDISHASDETFWDVLEVTRAPIIASHSNSRALADHPRNMTDDMIRAMTANNGVVMINFMNPFIDQEQTEYWKIASGWQWFWHPRHPEPPLSLVVDHIDHVVQVAGIDHVGLGSDFDGMPFLPEELKDVGDFPNITVELVRRGYTDEDIRKILGGNVLRVLADVERVATQPLKD